MEQFLHHSVAHLGAAEFIHHAFVVVGTGTAGEPFVADAAIGELPQEHAAEFRVGEHYLDLLAQDGALPLL